MTWFGFGFQFFIDQKKNLVKMKQDLLAFHVQITTQNNASQNQQNGCSDNYATFPGGFTTATFPSTTSGRRGFFLVIIFVLYGRCGILNKNFFFVTVEIVFLFHLFCFWLEFYHFYVKRSSQWSKRFIKCLI